MPAGVSFLDTLAKGLYERVGTNKDALADMRILLPTRRGCRGLREAFLRQTNGAPIILPHMQPIGDIDQDEISIKAGAQAQDILDIKPAISQMHRTILLARLVQKVDGFVFSDDQAFGLSAALGQFIDQVHTEGLSLTALDQLVPESLATHWNINLQFLNILKTAWPMLLESYGMIDPGLRRRLLMEAQANFWNEHPPQNPVIVAGTTGSIPATANILKTVLDLPQGEVILPGLDQHLDQSSWEDVSEGHPQYTLKKLIDTIRIDRENIQLWPDLLSPELNSINQDRLRLVSELMRPAPTVYKWNNIKGISQNATNGLALCECETADEEAHVVALIMREVLEDNDQKKTAALITPDRFLGRRVEAILKRWNIDIDDSAGIPLPESSIGRFFIALLDVLENDQAPISLLSLIKHPLFTAGVKKGWGNALAKSLETDECIRGLKPSNGIMSIIDRTDNPDIKDKLAHLNALLSPAFERLKNGLVNTTTGDHYLKGFLIELIKTLETCTDKDTLWQGEAGEAASSFFTEMLELTQEMPPLSFVDFKTILINQMSQIAVRPRFGTHPRLSIFGQIEARLVQADTVILGSLNEDSWPASPKNDPWMSRPMRTDMGLPSPEQSVTLAAHDFAQGISAPEVFITRAKKAGGTPTVPSRWLQRLDTVAESIKLPDIRANGQKYIMWAKSLNSWDGVPTLIERPAPTPHLHYRPDRISVTDIEKLICDPYHIYAKYVLKLKPLKPLEEDLSNKERGSFIHDVFDQFKKQYPRTLPNNAFDECLRIGKDTLAELIDNPEIWASWWPRFERISQWFISNETAWENNNYRYLAGEEKATLEIENITIVGRCDRIDQHQDGSIAIIDYKTGGQYSATKMKMGYTPQLPVEGLMIEQNAFEKIPANDVSYLGYWVMKGLKTDGEITKATDKTRTKIDDIMQCARDGLPNLISAYQDETMPYLSLPIAGEEPRFQDFAHLARVAEWSNGTDDDEESA